jgi:hypothetical protein
MSLQDLLSIFCQSAIRAFNVVSSIAAWGAIHQSRCRPRRIYASMLKDSCIGKPTPKPSKLAIVVVLKREEYTGWGSSGPRVLAKLCESRGVLWESCPWVGPCPVGVCAPEKNPEWFLLGTGVVGYGAPGVVGEAGGANSPRR